MRQRLLVIDDLRHLNQNIAPVASLYVARTSQQAIEYLSELDVTWHYVFWDHDLGGDDDTRKVVQWLAEQALDNDKPIDIERCMVHTSNTVGADWLMASLSGYPLYYDCHRISAKGNFTQSE